METKNGKNGKLTAFVELVGYFHGRVLAWGFALFCPVCGYGFFGDEGG